MKRGRKSLTSLIATIAIIVLLILSQPATSLLVSLNVPPQGYANQPVKITGTITIQNGEWVNITEIRFSVTRDGKTDSHTIPLSSPVPVSLSNTSSQIINATVNVSTATFGYGYGYGYIDTGYGYGYYGQIGWAFGYGYGYGTYGYHYGTFGYNAFNATGNAVIVYDIYWLANEPGSYNIQLTVKVKDRDGSERTFTSQPGTIVVQQSDTTPPEIGNPSPFGPFETPEKGSEVWGNVTLIIVAHDEQGGSGMSHVLFYYQNETSGPIPIQICNVTGAPNQSMWTCYWDTSGLQDGRYNLTAVAYDKAGNNNSATTWVKLDNDRLVVTASSDTVQTFANQPVTFYANYTHYGVPINSSYGGNCSINVTFFNFTEQGLTPTISYSAYMDYNSTLRLYVHTNDTGFPNWGMLSYNITCTNTYGFQNETKTNTSWITLYRSRSGTIYNLSSGDPVKDAIITIEQMVVTSNSPPKTGWTNTTYSDDNGNYTIVFTGPESPINSIYTMSVRSQDGTLTSPILPPMPGPFPHQPNQTGINIFLVPAANLTLNAYNASGPTEFTAEIFDRRAGMPVKILRNIEGNYSLLIPANRSYDIVVHKEGPQGTPPVTYSLNSSNATGDVYVNVSLIVNEVTVSGNLTGVTDVEYYNITAYVGIGSFYATDFNVAKDVQTSNSSNNYSLKLAGTKQGVKYLIVAYAENNTGRYMGSKEITAYNVSALSGQDITLYPLYGSYRTGGDVSTNKTRFIFVDSDGNNITGIHLEVNVSEPDEHRVYSYSVESTNYVDLSIVKGSNVTLKIFSPQSPPRKKVYNSTQLASHDTFTITLPKMEFKDPMKGSPLQNVSLKFIKTGCTTPYPSASCVLYEVVDATHFDPMKALMAGNLNIRTEQQNGMVVEFMNVDLINSGPPDAHFSPNATEEIETDDTFAQVWQVGSFAPEVYGYVLIGIPYNESEINESDTVKVKFRYLYDDNMNVIWNASEDPNALKIPSAYSDFNQSYFTTGINCSDTYTTLNASGGCYINKTDNMVWFTIPHFSGGAPQIEGTKPTAAVKKEKKKEEGAPTGGGGGGGGGAALPPPLAAPSEFYESIIKYLRAGEPRIIVMTSDVIDKIGILEIQAVLEQTMSVSATVSRVSSLPSGVSSPEGEVHSFFEIVFTQYGTQTKVEPSGYFKHRISKEWLKSVGADASDVLFLKWDGSKWIELSSEVVEEDDDYYYFKVNLDSFSLFAVVAKKKVAPPAPQIPEETPELPAVEETKEVTTPPPATPTPEKPAEGFPIHYIAIGLAIIIAAIVAVILLRRR